MSINTASSSRISILLTCAIVGFLVFYLVQPTIMLTAEVVLFVGLLSLSLRWPETGTLVVLFAIYSNISVLVMRSATAVEVSAGSPDRNPRITVVLAALSLFLAAPLLYQMFVRKERLVFDRGFVLMLTFFTATLASSFFAQDERIAGTEIAYLLFEGLALYFLLTNIIWDFSILRRAVWALLLAGSLMAGFSIIQKITHTETNDYRGFAQVAFGPEVNPEARETIARSRAAGKINSGGETVGHLRAAGPIGGPNEYGQILLFLLPLGVLQFRIEPSRTLRALAVTASTLILGGIILTFSRASLLAAAIVFLMMAFMGLLNLRHILVSVIAIGLLTAVLDPEVVTRMLTLERLSGVFSRTNTVDQAPDSSAVVRYVLTLAAWHVFLDHPILGVGPGQFAKYYSSDYSSRVGLINQNKPRPTHDEYMAVLAETGLIGSACFISIIAVIMYGLWKERGRLRQSHPELALVATAFFLSLVTYTITAFFSHLSSQRYFWLQLALSSAAIRIIHDFSKKPATDQSFLSETAP